MIKIRQLIVCLLIVLTGQSAGFSQPKVTAQTIKKIESYMNELEKAGFSGTVLVEAGGRAVVSKGYSFRDVARREKNTPATVFDIGSVTKQFTAAAILKLEMQGRLSTDDKISKYFQNAPPDKSEITIHELLRHSSGLQSTIGGDFEKISEPEFVEKVLNSPLRFETGARFGYSNIGYSLLALIVEKVSGQTYERYLYENLWKPAAMESTGYKRPNFDKDLIAIGYKEDEVWGKPIDQAWDGDAPYLHLKGNGGILSTTGDLSKWNRALLTDKILSKAAKEKYYHPKLRPGENENPYYAYGWDILKTKRNTILTRHNGINGIFYADFYRFIDEGVTIVMLSNKAQRIFAETVLEISKMIFDANYKPEIPIAETKENRAFTEEIIKIALEKNLSAATDSYRKRDRKLDLLEGIVNAKGYDLLSAKKTKEAIEIFKLNVFAFPRSANAFDSLGEAYLENGEKESAIENYRKSLALNPDNKNAEEMLKKLAGK
jgi:CubicO group peptidase (beta-lactamase class C family)